MFCRRRFDLARAIRQQEALNLDNSMAMPWDETPVQSYLSLDGAGTNKSPAHDSNWRLLIMKPLALIGLLFCAGCTYESTETDAYVVYRAEVEELDRMLVERAGIESHVVEMWTRLGALRSAAEVLQGETGRTPTYDPKLDEMAAAAEAESAEICAQLFDAADRNIEIQEARVDRAKAALDAVRTLRKTFPRYVGQDGRSWLAQWVGRAFIETRKHP
jgi:hypothetical protein